MRQRIAIWIGLLLVGSALRADERVPLLTQAPTLSSTDVVFVYGGVLWTVPRAGGRARQLTTGGHEEAPAFSPDGRRIAFSARYDGNLDAYVMPAEGGEPRRLTWYPGDDRVVGWTPDGKSVLFSSDRDAYADFHRLYTVPLDGGPAVVLPMWRGETASYSPDGTRVAYVPNEIWQTSWKRYRGGQTTPVDVIRLADLSRERIPRNNSNDRSPVWFGDAVYFLSDRNGPVSLFAYDTASKAVRQVIENKGLDLKTLSAGPDALVYEQFGEIHLFDPKSGADRRLEISIAGDLPAVRPHFEKVADEVQGAAISPSGARAVFEARGEILTVPAEKGDVRNLTRSTSVAERDPAWSPDGKSIAFFSDASGEYALHVVDPSGAGAAKSIDLGTPPSFFYEPTWSPDSRRIAYTDKRLNLWYVDVAKGGKPVKVATDRYEDPTGGFSPQWSPDGKWLAYTKLLPSHLRAVFLYSLETKKETQVTESLGDARYPAFDRDGKLLYFTVSTDLGLSSGWLDLSSYQHPVLRNVYAAVLKATDPSPVEPQSDEEKAEDAKGDDEGDGPKADDDKKGPIDKSKKDDDKSEKKSGKGAEKSEKGDKNEKEGGDHPVEVTIDLEGLGQRIVALPIDAANYVGLDAGTGGTLFLSEVVDVPRFQDSPEITVSKFDLTTRKTEPYLSDVSGFALSARGDKALYRQGDGWFIVATDAEVKPGDGALNLSAMEVRVDPRAEWKQMYQEVWRIERDFFYDPNHHGLDLAAAEKKYAPYLAGLGGRGDLNYLFDEMLGELTVGHLFVNGGDVPEATEVKGGLLGADYEIANGRYRFARIYSGENWNPDLTAPLTQPGVNVKRGEYLLEVEGREVRPPAEVYSYFENTAGRQIKIKVGPTPDGKGAREVTVVPLPSDLKLRNRAWEEDNRRTVDRLSGGKLAYVHVPDTNVGGYVNFNRFYYAQVGKLGAIIDERYNHGGQVADYIVDQLKRPLRNCVVSREGEPFCSPLAQIYGPKTLIINEMAGSGGDALPWMFRQDAIGPLVGTRTWGGLVGIYGYPTLIDGGSVTAPRVALYGLKGDWEVENRGIPPDIEVENDPASVAAGHDPQLEKAIEVTMEALKKGTVTIPEHPAYPNYHKE